MEYNGLFDLFLEATRTERCDKNFVEALSASSFPKPHDKLACCVRYNLPKIVGIHYDPWRNGKKMGIVSLAGFGTTGRLGSENIHGCVFE